MAFKKMKQSGYSKELAEAMLGDEDVKLASLVVATQYVYANDKRTDTIKAYQIHVVTDSQEPFKVKFEADNKPNLDGLHIGDVLTFDNLQATEFRYNVYFKADAVHKA